MSERVHKTCSRCGASFVCGPEEGRELCWCADVPPVEFAPGEDCLCETCLRRAARAGRSKN